MSSDHTGGLRATAPRDPLEAMLLSIWEDLLGKPVAGTDAAFARAGGTPALLERLGARVTEAAGQPVPDGVLHPDVTVGQLAQALRAMGPSVDPAPRVYLARNVGGPGARPALFFLHGDFSGQGFYCLRLAALLGRDQPFYALAPHGLDGAPLPATVEAMAADRLATLTSLQPRGPYRLAGHCNGAVVALEMAQQLLARGERVDRLILIAPWVVLGTRLEWRLAAASPRDLARALAAAARWRLQGLAGRTVSAPGPPVPAAGPARALYAAYGQRIRAYQPRPYPGRATVLWARDEPVKPGADPRRTWRHLAPQAAFEMVPGEHLTCVTTHVVEVVGRMRSALDAEGSASGPGS